MLVNEFGEIGVDGSLLSKDGVVVEEVAGGCMCCVAAPLFTVGLNRLIRQHRPDRILIEPSGLGHPAQVLDTLAGPLYANVVETRATLCLMDARHLDSAAHRSHPNFLDQIHLADVLIANKRDLYETKDFAAFEQFASELQPRKARLACVADGHIDAAWLDLVKGDNRRAAFPEAHAFLVETQADTLPPAEYDDWLLIEGHGDGYHHAGWRIAQRAPWPLAALRTWLDALPFERRKGLCLTGQGWQAFNQSDWYSIPAPADGLCRLELIDRVRPDTEKLDRQLRRFDIDAASNGSLTS